MVRLGIREIKSFDFSERSENIKIFRQIVNEEGEMMVVVGAFSKEKSL